MYIKMHGEKISTTPAECFSKKLFKTCSIVTVKLKRKGKNSRFLLMHLDVVVPAVPPGVSFTVDKIFMACRHSQLNASALPESLKKIKNEAGKEV